jgi:glyoxylase-like metal-dependent hydrolase (beta-lactamase superfamily II)
VRLVRASLLLAVAAVPLAAQPAGPNFDTVQIRTVPLADSLYMLMGAGGNIGLSVGRDGAFLVDDQFAPLTPKIIATVAAVTAAPVRFVLNTHWHGDHTGGNENLGKAGALIVAHENVRKRMNPEEFKDVLGRSQQAAPDALPVVTFTDAVTFYWNGEKLRAFHVPRAHTDGDVIIQFTHANVLHMGDLFNNAGYPFVDTESGGDVDGFVTAADAALAIAGPDTKIIPGHGALADATTLRTYRDMIDTVRTRVRALKQAGKTEDDVVAARPTADLDGTYAGGQAQRAERFVRAVYQTVD